MYSRPYPGRLFLYKNIKPAIPPVLCLQITYKIFSQSQAVRTACPENYTKWTLKYREVCIFIF